MKSARFLASFTRSACVLSARCGDPCRMLSHGEASRRTLVAIDAATLTARPTRPPVDSGRRSRGWTRVRCIRDSTSWWIDGPGVQPQPRPPVRFAHRRRAQCLCGCGRKPATARSRASDRGSWTSPESATRPQGAYPPVPCRGFHQNTGSAVVVRHVGELDALRPPAARHSRRPSDSRRVRGEPTVRRRASCWPSKHRAPIRFHARTPLGGAIKRGGGSRESLAQREEILRADPESPLVRRGVWILPSSASSGAEGAVAGDTRRHRGDRRAA
jgi:hypothetical protein